MDDTTMDQEMGHLLRWGVMLACAVMVVGGAVYLMRHGAEIADYRHFRGEPAEYRTVRGIVGAAKSGGGRGMIQVGCLVMILTPVARVIFSIYGFGRQRDWLYAGVSSVVLGLLVWANR